MTQRLNTPDLCAALARDPYSFPEMFEKSVDGNVNLVETLQNGDVLVFQKSFDGTIAEHAFVVCVQGKMNWQLFEQFHKLYEQGVLKHGNGDFREVEPVFSAREFAEEVLGFVEIYNMQKPRRKPFRLFTF